MAPSKQKVLITIPAYNEEKTLPAVLGEIREVLSKWQSRHNFRCSFLVVDDGSTDRTAEAARQCGAKVVSNKANRGLAETFKVEMRECLKLRPDIIIHTDADGQYAPQHIPELIQKVQEGYDLVLGSRFRGKEVHMPLLKKLGNHAFSFVLSSLTKAKITDSTTGFRAFTPEIAEKIEYINTFTYTQEQIIKAAKQGYRITEVPISTRRTRASRLFKNPFEYALKAWINIFRIYRDYDPLKFFGIFGCALLFVGLLLGAWVVYSVLLYGNVGGIPRVILSAVLILTGFQIVLFGFFADMFRK